MRSDIVTEGVFPDYALPDHTGTVRTLGELQGRDPMVLTLEFRASVGAQWTFLSDPGRIVQKDLDIQRAATAETRPDWDLSTPGLHEAWAAGDHSPFQGWDRKSGNAPAAL